MLGSHLRFNVHMQSIVYHAPARVAFREGRVIRETSGGHIALGHVIVVALLGQEENDEGRDDARNDDTGHHTSSDTRSG